MLEVDIRALSYRELQKACKELGIRAGGKTAELQERLIEQRQSGSPGMIENEENCHNPAEKTQTSGTPTREREACLRSLPPPGQIPTTPDTETRRVLARKAIGLAAKTPLPEQIDFMTSPAPKQQAPSAGAPVKRSSGGCGLAFTFLLVSALIAAVSMYTYRIDWEPVIKAGKQDVQAGFKEYSKQAQALGEKDYSSFLTHKEQTTMKAKALYEEHVLPLPDRMQALYGEYSQKLRDYVSELSGPSSESPGSPSRSYDNGCQAAVNGFEITFMAPSRTFSADHDEHGKALMKMLVDLSNVHQRFKSVTHIVEFPEEQDTVPSVEYAMKTLGCEVTLAGQCMLVDFEKWEEQEEDQGAALQALVAPQLKKSPSSIFFIANIEYLDASGAAVLLALVGEHGVINQPGCDLSTQSSAALIFVPVDNLGKPDVLETLEDFEQTIANNVAVVASGGARPGESEEVDPAEVYVQIEDEIMKEAETTAAALRRRVSENVLRAKPIGSINSSEADEKLSEKAASARAVTKPTAAEVAEAQKRRLEAEAGAADEAKEL